MRCKLIVFDMDGVIFESDNFWMRMHRAYDTVHPGVELTEKYLKTDIKKLADEVIGKLWKGKKADKFFELIKNSKYNPGVKETIQELKKMGIKICILTSGPIQLAKRVQKELDVDYVYGHEIIIEDNIITGKYNWLSYDFSHKGETFLKICKEMEIDPKDTIVVGDNEQDIYKFAKAGFSIAFNSKSENLKKVADAVIDGNDLRKVLEFVK